MTDTSAEIAQDSPAGPDTRPDPAEAHDGAQSAGSGGIRWAVLPDDPELAACAAILHALDPLDPAARDRVLLWAHGRFPYSVGADHDPDAPRVHYLDDLPATGDLIHVDGQDMPVTNAQIQVDREGLVVRLRARPSDGPEEGGGA